jgi:hypothetical protein
MTKGISIFLTAALLLLTACSEKNEIKAPGVSSSDGDTTAVLRPDTQIRGAQIFLYDGSVVTTDIKADYLEKYDKQDSTLAWNLDVRKADYLEKYDKQDSTLAWNLDVRFFNKQGQQTSHLVSDSGLVRETINLMIANGSVVAVNEDDVRLETEQLIWHGNEEMIRTDSFVTIYQKGDTLRGWGLETDKELKRIKIKKQVSGSLADPEKYEE